MNRAGLRAGDYDGFSSSTLMMELELFYNSEGGAARESIRKYRDGANMLIDSRYHYYKVIAIT
jgi:hypothetical protein